MGKMAKKNKKEKKDEEIVFEEFIVGESNLSEDEELEKINCYEAEGESLYEDLVSGERFFPEEELEQISCQETDEETLYENFIVGESNIPQESEELINKETDEIQKMQSFVTDKKTKEEQESVDFKDDRLYLSTGAERVLIEELYNVIIRGNNVKTRSDISIEGIIFKIIAEKVLEKGYKGFYKKEITNALSQYGHLSNRFLEKYEFLFKHSDIFKKAERNKLLKAIKSYRVIKKLTIKNMYHHNLLDEYKLIKTIQEAYFKEHKEYLSLTKLGIEVIGKGRFSFRTHFTQRENNFRPSTIFKIECWSKKNLTTYLKDVQNKISKWRRDHNDNSVYNIQDTPIKKIAYSILILYAQINDKAISINELDGILNDMSAITFGSRFFGNRFKKDWKDHEWLVSDDKMNLLKSFVKMNFEHKAPKETQQLIDDINDYIKIPRKTYYRHSKRFLNLKPYQLKILIDITKGMDTLYCDFFSPEELSSSKIEKKVCRGHLDEDPDFEFIFDIFADGSEYSYRIKLAPLRFKTSHNDLHDSMNFPTGVARNIIKARMRHLYEIYKMSYDYTLTKQDYIKIFREKFRNKKDYIFQYNKDVNIWSQFEEGKIFRLNEKIIKKFVNRWIKSKTISELTWYNEYYKEFYHKKYLIFMKNLETYKKESLKNGRISPFYKWFLAEYLPNEKFP